MSDQKTENPFAEMPAPTECTHAGRCAKSPIRLMGAVTGRQNTCKGGGSESASYWRRRWEHSAMRVYDASAEPKPLTLDDIEGRDYLFKQLGDDWVHKCYLDPSCADGTSSETIGIHGKTYFFSVNQDGWDARLRQELFPGYTLVRASKANPESVAEGPIDDPLKGDRPVTETHAERYKRTREDQYAKDGGCNDNDLRQKGDENKIRHERAIAEIDWDAPLYPRSKIEGAKRILSRPLGASAWSSTLGPAGCGKASR